MSKGFFFFVLISFSYQFFVLGCLYSSRTFQFSSRIEAEKTGILGVVFCCFVFCVLCVVCCVLCVMCYVLCVMCYVLCVMCYVLCVMCYVLCVMCYVLCVMFVLLCGVMWHV